MRHQEFAGYKRYKNSSGIGTTCLRIVLLFGSIVVALSLVLVPMIISSIEHRFSDDFFSLNVDTVITGSITSEAGPHEKHITLPLSLKSGN